MTTAEALRQALLEMQQRGNTEFAAAIEAQLGAEFPALADDLARALRQVAEAAADPRNKPNGDEALLIIARQWLAIGIGLGRRTREIEALSRLPDNIDQMLSEILEKSERSQHAAGRNVNRSPSGAG